MITTNQVTHRSAKTEVAQSFFAAVIRSHSASTNSATEGAAHQGTLELFSQALEAKSTGLLTVAQRDEQARLLLHVRLTQRISSMQILEALSIGSSVDEIVHYAEIIHQLGNDNGTESSDTNQSLSNNSTSYPFSVATKDGDSKFTDWLSQLDQTLRRSVVSKLERINEESVKRLKPLEAQSNLYEVRIFDGPGLRVYIGNVDNEYVLLIGGRKDRQLLDILKAAKMLRDLQSANAGYHVEKFSITEKR